MNKPFLRQMGL
jgi:hypothetical protein